MSRGSQKMPCNQCILSWKLCSVMHLEYACFKRMRPWDHKQGHWFWGKMTYIRYGDPTGKVNHTCELSLAWAYKTCSFEHLTPQLSEAVRASPKYSNTWYLLLTYIYSTFLLIISKQCLIYYSDLSWFFLMSLLEYNFPDVLVLFIIFIFMSTLSRVS